jgi:hypothetical protein
MEEGLVVTDNMNIDISPLSPFELTPQPLLFGLPTPAPPPTVSTTPCLSAEDPIGDALTTIWQAIAETRQSSHRGPDHTPLTREGWYKYICRDAHVWMDIPLLYANPDDDKLSPAKYLKATLVAETLTLLGCQGQGQEIYSEQLVAYPFHAIATHYNHYNSSLEILENPFDARVERSLLFLGDPGILGDVYTLQSIPLHREGLLRRKEDVMMDLSVMGAQPQLEPFTPTAIDFQQLLE